MAKTTQINVLLTLSDFKFNIRSRTGNAQVTGKDYGAFKLEYSESNDKMYAYFYENQNDADPVAVSDIVDVSTLPGTVTLNEYDGSGVTATIDVEGVI